MVHSSSLGSQSQSLGSQRVALPAHVASPAHTVVAAAPERRKRPITKAVFRKYNTTPKVQAMRQKQDAAEDKLYAQAMSHWKDKGTYLDAVLPPGLSPCSVGQLRVGKSVVAYDAVSGETFDVAVVRVKRGRLATNPDWVICSRVSDGKKFLVPRTLVGLRVGQAQ